MAAGEKTLKKASLQFEGEMGVPKDHISFKDGEHGERHFVRKGEGYEEVTKPLPEPVRIHRDRVYRLNDTESFIKYVGKYGNPKKGIIFCGENDLNMFFDEVSRAEKIHLPFSQSLEVMTFLGKTGTKEFTQKEFVKALETFPDVVEGGNILLPNVERLKIETEVNFESNIDQRDHVFMYKERDGSQTARIPKQIVLTLPFFERSSNQTLITADLEIERPRSENEKPKFTLVNPRHERTLREAFNAEVVLIKAALKDWTFVCGNP